MIYAVKRPNEKLEVCESAELLTVEEYQKLVGGYFECIYLPHNIAGVVNEEGQLMQLPYNFTAVGTYVNDAHRIVGTCVFVNEGVEDFESLNSDQVKYLEEWSKGLCG